jgi:hypothetical protein
MATTYVHNMFSMNAASSLHLASPAEAAVDVAVVRGVALIGVLKGFTRRVFGLGRVMKQVLVRLDKEGVDPHSANSGFDLMGVLNLLSRALKLADALSARLRTAAVALALVRPRSATVRREWIERQAEDGGEGGGEDYMADPLRRISYGRTDERSCSEYRQAIADMSDREVLDVIYSHLLRASAILGETEEAARVTALGYKAAALLAEVNANEVPDDVAPPEVALHSAVSGRADRVMSDGSAEPADVPGSRPPPRAVERGPP